MRMYTGGYQHFCQGFPGVFTYTYTWVLRPNDVGLIYYIILKYENSMTKTQYLLYK